MRGALLLVQVFSAEGFFNQSFNFKFYENEIICVFGFIGFFGVNEVSADAWRYEMQYERCNRVDKTFMVCRPTELYIGCSVSA
jgi:hypothetical protein